MRSVLLIKCPDKKGLVYTITGILYKENLNIISNHEFVDSQNNIFFMRTEFEGDVNSDKIHLELKDKIPDIQRISIKSKDPKKIIVFASKEHHCLGDLLIKNEYKDLGASIEAIISNHEILKPLAEKFNIPFHYISHENISREYHEIEINKILQHYEFSYIVLAKYMRILSPEFISFFENRIINIHHSFLPAFIGSRPYEQAFNRGVKIVGATAHFVNNDLDEGPIISQNVINVDHTHTEKDMKQAGQEIEKITLVHALKLVLEDRIFIQGNRTIIFD